jgi:chromosome partitioning protein
MSLTLQISLSTLNRKAAFKEISMIITFANQKGGVGKTTLGLHVAAELARRGQRVKVIDLDPQHSALDWAEARDGADLPPLFEIEGFPKATLHKHIAAKSAGFDAVAIDVPPQNGDLSRSALLAADLVVIPVQPSPYDVWAARETVKLIQEAIVFKEALKSVFAINRAITGTAISRDVRSALAEYAPIPTLTATVAQRVAFAESAARGQVVQELSEDSPATREIIALVNELLEYAV